MIFLNIAILNPSWKTKKKPLFKNETNFEILAVGINRWGK